MLLRLVRVALLYLIPSVVVAFSSYKLHRRNLCSRVSSTSSSTATFASTDDLQWTSAVSTVTDLNAALTEAIALASANVGDMSKVNLALFFVSSIYETAGSFDTLNENFRKTLPVSCIIVGCTAGAVIGPADPLKSLEPSESEARASISVIFARLGDGVSLESFHLEKGNGSLLFEDLQSYQYNATA